MKTIRFRMKRLGALLQESWCKACLQPPVVTHDPMPPDSLFVTVCIISFSNRTSTSGSDSRLPKILVQISNRWQYSSPAARGRPSKWGLEVCLPHDPKSTPNGRETYLLRPLFRPVQMYQQCDPNLYFPIPVATTMVCYSYFQVFLLLF